MRRIILASGSPRRKELLGILGVDFDVVPSDFVEYLDDKLPPEQVAVVLGLGKARAVAERYPEAIVIGSDTIVTVMGKQLGKADTVEEAREMWRLVTSAPNKVTTSVVVICGAKSYEFTAYDNAFVTFKPYDEKAIEAYLATDDWHDKAAAWSIQKCHSLIANVEGQTDTIIGLPTKLLIEPFAHFGIPFDNVNNGL